MIVFKNIADLEPNEVIEKSIFICSDPLVFYNFQPKILNLVNKKFLKTILLANATQIENLKTNDTEFINAILYTNCSLAEVHDAVNYIITGQNYRCRKMENNQECQHDFESFLIKNNISLREIEIIRLVIEGLNSKEIGDKLHISYNTVTTHRRNINKKLGLKGPNDLMRLSLTAYHKN
jgi:DNA-binding NarL/FixJ family response regulator